jgi:hypothetical protein
VNYFRGAGGAFSTALARPEAFQSPGMPRTAWLGFEYRFSPVR